MNFGQAIEALKEGRLVCRSGWNGKNMHIYLEEAETMTLPHPRMETQVRTYPPVIVMFTAGGEHQRGWLASQADILAEDWEIKE